MDMFSSDNEPSDSSNEDSETIRQLFGRARLESWFDSLSDERKKAILEELRDIDFDGIISNASQLATADIETIISNENLAALNGILERAVHSLHILSEKKAERTPIQSALLDLVEILSKPLGDRELSVDTNPFAQGMMTIASYHLSTYGPATNHSEGELLEILMWLLNLSAANASFMLLAQDKFDFEAREELESYAETPVGLVMHRFLDRLNVVNFRKISETEKRRLHSIKQLTVSSLQHVLHFLRNLDLTYYSPRLHDVNSHMPSSVFIPEQPFDHLPMWPTKRRERYDSMQTLDRINWLGPEITSHTVNATSASEHKILYRDFLDFIQQQGYAVKKVTATIDHQRISPGMQMFRWSGIQRKYRPHADMYFHAGTCKLTGKEMRIGFSSTPPRPYERGSIDIVVGHGFFVLDEDDERWDPIEENDDMTYDELEAELQRMSEEGAIDFLQRLVDAFESWQSTHGLLKNAKFDGTFEEIFPRDRSFDDMVLSQGKQELLRDNVFNVITYAELLKARGLPTNRGVMLAGPPGVGKSLTINAIIKEAGCTVLWASFSQLHENMEHLFKTARKYAPTILLLEDIDALGITSQRTSYSSGAGLSTLLNLMDGVESNDGVVTVATSNHPELMDWALINRPGRFDVRLDFSFPDEATLERIFKLKLRDLPCEKDLNLIPLVKKMPKGFTGAHVHEVVMQANFIELHQSKGEAWKITQPSLEQAVNRAVYNFEQFMQERPGLQFTDLPGAIHDHEDDGLSHLFG